MDTNEFKRIKAEAYKELGSPLVQPFWDTLDEHIGTSLGDYDGDPDGLKEYLNQLESLVRLYVDLTNAVRPSRPKRSGENVKPKPSKRYMKPLEDRVYLVDFVIEAKGGVAERANWPKIVAAWNEAHPHDRRTVERLKDAYYKAMKDSDVEANYIAMKSAEILPYLQAFMANWPQRRAETVEGIRKGFEAIMEQFRQHPEAKNLSELIAIQKAKSQKEER